MGSITERVKTKMLVSFLHMKGYKPYNAYLAYSELKVDFTIPGISWKQRLHAYRKGYCSERVKSYHLENDDHYLPYMPELKYYTLHPVNGPYSKWIDDKMTFKYVFSPFNEYLPAYYYQLNENSYWKLMDCPDDYPASLEGVMTLLKAKGELVAKLLSGTKGDGFYKFSFFEGSYYLNDKLVTEERIREVIKSLDDYLITEFICAHPAIRKYYPHSPNSLRVMMIRDAEGPEITGAFIRFGTNQSGVVDNISAGGIFAGIDLEDGSIFKPYTYDDQMNLVDAPVHPDTQVPLEGQVPYWETIKKKLYEISDYFPQLKYMGFDIIITEGSFKMIEINSLQGLQHMQLYYPAFKNPHSKRFFTKLFEEKAQAK